MAKRSLKQLLEESTPPVTQEYIPTHMSSVTNIVFPTDIWGLCTDVKYSLQQAAARVSGSPDKYKLLKDTLELLIQHVDARYQDDRARREQSAPRSL